MASLFDDLMARLDATVTETFGEADAALLLPCVLSQYSGRTPDQARAQAGLNGVFSLGSGEETPRGQAASERKGTTRYSTARAEFWISAVERNALPYQIKTGDRLTLPGRPGAPTYAVADMQDTDEGDLNLILIIEDENT